MDTRPTAGFSLTELMIVLAILAIVGLVGAPGMLSYVPTQRVNGAAKTLASEMNLTRMQAIARNKVQHVTFDTAAQCLKIWEDSDNDWSTPNTLLKTVSFSSAFPNVSIDYNTVTGVDGSAVAQPAKFGTTTNPVRATFLPNGLLADPGVFYLLPSPDKGKRDDRMRAIEVSRAGRTVMYRYDGASTPPWKEY